MDRQIGVKVSVRLEDGDVLRGWLYDEDLRGIFVSFDPKGRVIRYVPRREVINFSYDQEASKADFEDDRRLEAVKEAESFDSDLLETVTESLSKVDFNRVRRIALRLRTERHELKEIASSAENSDSWEQQEPTLEDHSGFEIPLNLVLRLTDSYSNLVDELERSGLGKILVEHKIRIGSFVSPDTLPVVDAGVANPDELRAMIAQTREQDEVANTSLGRAVLQEIPPEEIVRRETSARNAKPEATGFLGIMKPRRLRKIAALGKVALGGTLAATNVSLGITAGVVTALPTLGIGTVGAAAGIVGSTYTGLAAACDGLKDYASILEETKS
jgi:hypothetical protein